MEKVAVTTLIISSVAFLNREYIPSKYTCDGDDVNPPIKIENIPGETISLALIVDDPDASLGIWNHWIVWNIPAQDQIKENSIPGTEGINSFKKHKYAGPCPPIGTHHFYFRIYALDTKLDLDSGAKREDLEKAMEGHILASGELVGLYERER